MFDEILRRRRERKIDRLTTRIRQLNELLSCNQPYYDPWRRTDLKKHIQRHRAKLDSLGSASSRLNWVSSAVTRTAATRGRQPSKR